MNVEHRTDDATDPGGADDATGRTDDGAGPGRTDDATPDRTDDATGPDPPDDATGPDETEHAAHLARSRRVWDRWSDHYGPSERDFEPMREAAIDRLDLGAGDRVLEVGCGPGVNFERIRSEVGETGRLVAVDYSPGMVEKARARVDDHGWENVEVVRADATTADLGTGFDAALATLSMSVMPDPGATAGNVHRSLAPGGRFVVFDLRTVPSGPARVVNPLLGWFLRAFANWNPDGDVPGALAAAFAESEVVDTYAVGTAYTALARKRVE